MPRETKYARYARENGTLQNGKVYVAVTRHNNKYMLGLFAGQDISKNEAITEYTGAIESEKQAKQSKFSKSYLVRLPGTGNVIDAWDYAQCFQLPDDAKDNEDKIMPQKCAQKTLNRIINSGVGYMANHGSTPQVRNAKTVAVYKEPDIKLYLVATRDIQQDEEILWNYKNQESIRGF